MNGRITMGLGLIRDLVAAIVGLLILFGVDLTNDQVAGILLVVATAGALGSWIYQMRKSGGTEPVEPDVSPTGTTKVDVELVPGTMSTARPRKPAARKKGAS